MFQLTRALAIPARLTTNNQDRVRGNVTECGNCGKLRAPKHTHLHIWRTNIEIKTPCQLE